MVAWGTFCLFYRSVSIHELGDMFNMLSLLLARQVLNPALVFVCLPVSIQPQKLAAKI